MLSIIAENLAPFLVGVVVGGVTYYFICRSQNAIPPNDLDDKLISNRKALSMIHNFRANAPDDTVSGFLDKACLLEYMARVKTQCDAIGKTFTGLQYYFAKYDNDPVNGDRPTIVFYPTYDGGKNKAGVDLHVPFDPFISTAGNPVKVSDMNAQYIAAGSDTARTGTMYESKHVLNRSNMSPPNPPLTL